MKSRDTLNHIKQHEANLLVIHYSCETLGDSNQGLSPRITSIAVLHMASSTMHSFSIHLVAEVNKVNRDGIHDHYDDLEKDMLNDFYNNFVKSHQDCLWLHWNMSNINFGFEAIAHRFKVLTKTDAPQIAESKRFNLSTLILDVYGKDCVDDPRMVNLMQLNGKQHRDFLTGQEEVEAFKNKEYIKLHKSTMCKVYWFQKMYYRLQNRKIKTARTNFWNRVNELMEKPLVKVLGFVSVLYTIFQLVQATYVGFPLPQANKLNNNNSPLIHENARLIKPNNPP